MDQAMAMAAANPMLEIVNIKEMMTAMNEMAATCFTSCVDNFRSTMPDENERACLEACVGKQIETSQKLIENYNKVQEHFSQKTADYQDEKQKEYQAKGYFDENMELIPKKPVSQQEMEYEILEGRFGSFIASGLQKVLG